jgi:aspartate kinase
MTMKLVMKFGGSSLADGKKIRLVADIVKRRASKDSIVVVVSAMSQVTDDLILLLDSAAQGDMASLERGLNSLRIRHEDAARDALKSGERLVAALDSIEGLFEDLESLLRSVATLREVTAKTRDRVLSFGEALTSALLRERLQEVGLKAEAFSGGEAGIVTDGSFGDSTPLMDVTKMKVGPRLAPLMAGGVVPVVAGFTGIDQHGDVTTLGRGGSDYTATILGASLGVDEVWIWTDVDGIMTCDPKIVRTARLITELSYAEAMEMAAFGIKQFPPRAMEPAIRAQLPVRIRNTFNEDSPGTLIREDRRAGRGVVKTVALVREAGMITVSGTGMAGRPGTAAKVFDVLGRNSINILAISQSVSEAGITMLVRREALYRAVSTLEISLLGKGLIDAVSFEDDVSIVAVIGSGMKGTPGVAARIFQAAARKKVNVRMIAQGSSELNISFAVKEAEGAAAVRGICEAFGL